MLLPTLIAQASRETLFGKVTPPTGVRSYDEQVGGFGLMIFISNIVKFVTIVAGLWVFFNFILAGYEYITSNGDSSAHNKVKDRITMSIIGLVIILVAYTALGLLGLLLTGDASFFINPRIEGPVLDVN